MNSHLICRTLAAALVVLAAGLGLSSSAHAAGKTVPMAGTGNPLSTALGAQSGLEKMAAMYAGDQKVSIGEAQTRLSAITALTRSDALSTVLGNKFGGMWFDNESGVMNVGYVTAGAVPHVASLLGTVLITLGVGADRIRLVPVGVSKAKLLDTYKDASPLISQFELAQLGVSESRNELLLNVPADAPSSLTTELQQFVAKAGVKLETTVVPKSELQADPATCVNARQCDAPLHGGQEIRTTRPGGGDTFCSVADIGLVWNTWVLISAGHCFVPFSTSQVWRAQDNAGNWRDIGHQIAWTQGSWGDFGFVQIENLYWLTGWRSLANLEGNTDWPIQAVSANQAAWVPVCRTGRTSYMGCGYTQGGPYTMSMGGVSTANLYLANGSFGGYNMCADPGDSGGSVMSWTTLYGLTVGGSMSCTTGEGGNVYYQDHGSVSAITGAYWGISG